MAINFNNIGNISGVDGGPNVLSNPTSLQFGPDGRLYVSEQNGTINALTLTIENGEYIAVDHEVLVDGNGNEVVKNLQNHNDDGSNSNQGNRQVTGLVVTEDNEGNIVLFVSSSDPRISSNGEVNLDTNSGVITKVTQNGDSWDTLDIIRGLPRSEENHATNGLDLSADGTKLYVQNGGNTNNGAPSSFFSYTAEYTLSGALLEIDLTAIDALQTQTDPVGGQGGTPRNYVYDLPTLDDPNITNNDDGTGEDSGGLDEAGPWGGNDGLNQAILPADAPLRIYADGFRNQYDILITSDGDFYTVDNGSNGNLGGNPNTEGGDTDGDGVAGEAVNTPNNGGSGDPEPLFFIEEGGYYGHANPTRANQNQAWTVYNDSGNPDGSVPTNSVSDISDLVPAGVDIDPGFLIDPSKFAAGPGITLEDLSPAELEARLLESGVRIERDSPQTNALATVGSSSNGLAEYDSNGQAFGGVLDGMLLVTQFNDNITLLNPNDTNTGMAPIVDDEGNVLAANGVLQLNSFGINGLGNPLDVTIGPDGTVWVAEIGSNEVSVFAPSDLVLPDDPDFDNDGILNVDDPFQRDATNGGSALVFPNQDLFWSFAASGTGDDFPGPDGFGGGLTGVMIDGETDFEQFFQETSNLPGQDVNLDNVKFNTAAGGGATVIEFVSNGDPFTTSNSGEFLFHTGATVAPTVETFTVTWSMFNPGDAFTGNFQQIGGYIGTGDQSNFLKIVAIQSNNGEVQLALEDGDTIAGQQFLQADDLFDVPEVDTKKIFLSVTIDTIAETATPSITYEKADGTDSTVDGTALSIAGSTVLDVINGDYQVQGQTTGLAVGLFASNTGQDPADTFQAVFDDIQITATGDDSAITLYRVNAGGPEIAATDGGPDWEADTATNNSQYLSNPGNNNTAGFEAVDPGGSVPVGTPGEIFDTERWDAPANPEMSWSFDTPLQGLYEVRLFAGNGFGGTSAPGQRVFDVAIEGEVLPSLDNVDLSSLFGHQVGGMISNVVEVTDGTLNIDFIHGVENPLINGIEIIQLGVAPLTVSVVNGPVTVNEGDGQTSLSLLTNRTVPLAETVTIAFEIDAGDATPEVDFTVPGATFDTGTGTYSGSVDIAGGSSDVQIPINILNDSVSEASEVLNFTITGVSANAEIGTGSATVTIVDDDIDAGTVLYRVNAGGEEVAAIDGGPAWSADTELANSPFLVNPGSNNDFPTNGQPLGPIDTSFLAGFAVPEAVLGVERWDSLSDTNGEMAWSFDVLAGQEVEVRLYLSENFDTIPDVDTSGDPTGDRVFSVSVDGAVPAAFVDIDQYALAGDFFTGAVVTHTLVSDGSVDLEFLHGVQNPAIKGIEIVATGSTASLDTADGTPVSGGDFSSDAAAPTTITLQEGGSTTIVSNLEGGHNDRDFITVSVPEGFRLADVILEDYSADPGNSGFIGLLEGSDFVVDPAIPPLGITPDGVVDPGDLNGGLVFNEGSIGSDLLPGLNDTSSGFAGFDEDNLTGDLTFWLNQGGDASSAEITFVTESIEVGAATLTVNNNSNNIQISNFGNGSFVLTNTGSKDIASFTIDVTDALYPDSVFDPFGLAGDLVSKQMTINGGSGTGVMEPTGGYYLGAGGILGYEGIQLDFDAGTDGGFNPGETVAFAVDMDPNSIAGAAKGTLDSGADPAGWDIGGVSGAELIGSEFTITFTDGTTATGQLQGQTNGTGVALQGGSQGLATQDASAGSVDLTVNGFAPGSVGTYSDGGPQVIVNGPAGATARVVVSMGFIQPGENNFPDTADPNEYHDQLDAQLAALAASDFPANNAVDFQSFDIVLTGTDQDISSLFDFSQVVNGGPVGGGGWNDDVEGQLPLGIVASLIDPSNGNLPVGPVTDAIHLTYSEVIEADLSLTKDVSDATPVVGDTITFTLTVENESGQGATGVSVEDILPAGFSFVGANGDGTYDDTTGIWTIGAVGAGATASIDIDVTVLDIPSEDVLEPLYRVNVGGPEIAAADGSALAWAADQGTFGAPGNNPNLAANSTGNSTYNGNAGSAHAGPINVSDPSVPASAPTAVFNTERFDAASDPEMLWQFDVEAGSTVEVKLLFAELFGMIDAAGERVFDVNIEGNLVFDDVDPFAVAGAKGAFALAEQVVIDADGVLDIEFIHGVENPALKGIEISTVTPGFADGYDNFAQILTSDQADPDSAPGDDSNGDDDDATVSVTPVTTADLELTKTVSDETPAFGDTITFTLTVDHVDGVDATGVTVGDLLPSGFTYVSDTGGGAYDETTGIWTIGDVARDGSATLEITATVNGPVTPEIETVLYRVNAGGAEVAATDGGIAWSADTQQANSPFLLNPGSNNDFPGNGQPNTNVDISGLAGLGVPVEVIGIERWDNTNDANGEMAWAFDVEAGQDVRINLYLAELFGGLPDLDGSGDPTGDRVFDVSVDGVVPAAFDDLDPYALAGNAFLTGSVVSFETVSDGTIDLEFVHVSENTAIKGIEIIQLSDGTPIPQDYENYAEILTADQADPDSVAGDNSVGDDDDATVVVDATAAGENVATIAPVADAAEPSTNGQFLVSVENPVVVDTTITYSVAGTASNGTDYALLNGSVTIAAGTSSAPIDVTVIDDAEFEGDETVLVTLTGTSAGDTNIAIGAADNATVTIAEDDPEDLSGGQLGIQITPGAGLNASTFTAGSFILTNESVDGVQISSVSFDLSTGLLPDIVFDPTGAGGDATASPFTPNSGAVETGLVVPSDPASDPFSQPRNGGFDVLSIDFTDFDPGETFTFTTDIDPNSIQAVPGAGNAGSVSGYELVGSTVTVTFTDGTSQEISTGSLVHEGVGTAAANDGGSLGGALGRIQTEDAPAAPTLTLVGGAGDQVDTLLGTQSDINSTDFVVEVTGPANGTVDILQMDSRLFIASGNPPFDVSTAELPFYANEAMAGQVVTTVQLDGTGIAQVPLSLLVSAGGAGPDGGVNRLMAVAYEPGGSATGAVGLTSEPLVVKLGAPLVYDAPGVMTFDGTPATVLELAHDPVWQVPQGTIAFSFNAGDTSGQQGLFSKDASFFGGGGHTTIYLKGSELIARFQDTATSAELSFDGISAGQEYEIAATFGPDGVELWVDGNLVDSNPLPVSWEGNTEFLQWGGRGWGTDSEEAGFDTAFNGTMSDKQIYSEALTASQIAALASTSSGSNTPPDPADDTIVVDEDGSVNFDPIANDTDDDEDALSVSGIATQPTNGTVDIETDGTVTYTPNANFNGSDSFEVSVTDGVDTVTSTVNVTVNPVNDDPVAVDDAGFTVIETPIEIDVLDNDQDIDGDTLQVSAVTDGANGTVVNNGGSVTYTPNAGFEGSDSFTYTVDDQNGGAPSVATVTVDVLGAPNTPPTASDDAIVVDEDDSVIFQPGDNDTDADEDPVVASAIVSDPGNGTAMVNPDGTVTYTPNANFNGADSFDVQVTDGNGGFDVSTVNVTVNPVNDDPVANDDAASTSEEAPVIIDLLGNDTDVDGDDLTIDSLEDPANGTVVDNGNGTVTYTPDAGFSGQETFGYTVTDGTTTDSATVTVDVSSFPAPVVELPGDMVFDGSNGSVLELPHTPDYEVAQGTLNFSFNAADTNGQQGLFSKDASFFGGGGHTTIYLNGSTLIARLQNNNDSATFTLGGIVAGQAYDVAATFGPGGVALWVDGTLVDSDPLAVSWEGNDEFIQWGGRGWSGASGSPGFDAPFNGTISNKELYDIQLSADQIAALHADGPPNNAPTAVDDAVEVVEDGSVNFDPTVNDSDLDGDDLFVASVASGPANGSVDIETDGTVTYTPDADFFGNDSFDFVISDGNGGSDISTVNVTVTPVEDDPVATDDTALAQVNTPVDIDVLANDIEVDGETLNVVGNTDPSNGTVVLNPDGTFTYTPDTDFFGADSFDYTISDGDGPTDTATVTVNVSAAPVVPDPVFELGGVNSYSGSKNQVDNFAPDPTLNIAEGTVAFSFIDGNPAVRQGLVVKDASGFDGGGNHFAAYVEDGELRVRVQDGVDSTTFAFGINAGQEYEVATVFSASGTALWVDGALVAEDPNLGMDWTTNNEWLQVGALGWSSATGASNFRNVFSGDVADVQIFDQALSEDQILALAQDSSFDTL